MNKANAPFRYDYVGSFLRPAGLKQARADFQNGKIGADELKAAEDQAIRELVAKQQSAGYHVITDGEFRRATWHLDFMWGFHGVGHSRTEKGLPFHGENAMLDDTYLTGEVGVDSHPFVEHFRFVKALEDENTVAKLTIPAPAQFLEQMVMPFAMENTSKYYPNIEKLVEDLAAGYRKVIDDVYAAGCRNLQFDDCSWGMLVDPRACLIFDTDEKGLEAIKEQMLAANNLAIEGKPEDLVINTHVCRGNFHSTYASSGAYDSVAKTLLARENVTAYLPYADKSFDAVIVSNALHIVPQPEKALAEIRRVLKDDGVLIAPTFTHGNSTLQGRIKLFFMKLAGFPLNSRWSSADYLTFLRQNGWTVRKSAVLKASFPLTYAECVKPAVKGGG